jgi:hypothetical protein
LKPLRQSRSKAFTILSDPPADPNCGRTISGSKNTTLRGLEQNPNTNSRWAQLAREGKQVTQFLSDGRYIANVIDGELQFYGRRRSCSINN